MAVQQSQANEQLEALCTEIAEAHKALAEMAAKHDSARKACVQLRMQTLTDNRTLSLMPLKFGVCRQKLK